MSGMQRWISLKRWLPLNSSRRMIGVQRSAKISLATATGQNWPKLAMRPCWTGRGGATSVFSVLVAARRRAHRPPVPNRGGDDESNPQADLAGRHHADGPGLRAG